MEQMKAILVVMKWVFALGFIACLAFAIERLVHPTPYNEMSDSPFVWTMLGMAFACIILHVLCENAIDALSDDETVVE